MALEDSERCEGIRREGKRGVFLSCSAHLTPSCSIARHGIAVSVHEVVTAAENGRKDRVAGVAAVES